MSKPSVAILGASRGLGAAFAREWARAHPGARLLLVARKRNNLEALADELTLSYQCQVEILSADLAQPEQQEQVIAKLKHGSPARVFYFAGGGPYGPYAQKAWKDHQWALEVSFLAPARLLQSALNWSVPPQMVFTGSTVAENGAHAKAASYSAAKAALKALISSVVLENSTADVRLFSPGYMDTDLLPANAPVRHTDEVADPRVVASQLLDWVLQPKSDWYFPFTTLSK